MGGFMGVRDRAFALGALVIALAALLIIWGTTLTFASQGEMPSQEPSLDKSEMVTPQEEQPLDLDAAADQAEALSDNVYSGLDTTKEIIGKTEARKQAIEHGRDKASTKLQDLADRARQNQGVEPPLSETDKRVLRHISE
jgi:hypothetical protein